jgi:iron complex transport system substrate-binding protein
MTARPRLAMDTLRLLCHFVGWAVVLWIGIAAVHADTPPKRIVSMNLCTDVLLIDVVAPERIKGLSINATDPRISPVAQRAKHFTVVHDNAEEILALDPDLVITAEYTSAATVSLLQRLGRRVISIPMAQDIAGVRTAVGKVADAIGDVDAGKAVIAAFDKRIATARRTAPDGPAPTALIYQINALVSGPGTLEDEAMRIAGFRNLASELKLAPGGRVALETIVAHPPALLILSGPTDEYRTVVADALMHPALASVIRSRESLVLPWRQWICGSPYIADAIEALVAARQRIPSRRPPA